jgi:hypothetical protein
MSHQGGVLGIMASTFSLWASFRQSRNEPVLGLFYRYISENDFAVAAISVEAPVIREFALYVSKNSSLTIGNIDGDPTPNALWMGHWTHFVVKRNQTPEPMKIPPSISQSEKALQGIIRRGFPKLKPRRNR